MWACCTCRFGNRSERRQPHIHKGKRHILVKQEAALVANQIPYGPETHLQMTSTSYPTSTAALHEPILQLFELR